MLKARCGFYIELMAVIAVWLVVTPALVKGGHGEEENLDLITPERVKVLLDSGEKIIFIDLRPANEYNEKRLPGARSVPLGELPKRLGEIPKIGRIVLYCTCRPGDDAYANFFLRDNGYRNVAVLEEGFPGWLRRKYPIESGR